MSNQKALLREAKKSFKENKFYHVIELLSPGNLAKEPTAEFYILRARAHNRLNQRDEVIKYIGKALEIEPGNALAFTVRSNARYGKGEREGAMTDIAQAMTLDDRNYLAFNSRGYFYSCEGNYNAAIDDYTAAIGIKRDYDIAYCNRGIARRKMGEFSSALLDFNKAIIINDKYAIAYRNRGMLYEYSLRDYPKAIDDYDRAIGLDVEDGANISARRAALIEKIVEDEKKIAPRQNKKFVKLKGELKNVVKEILDFAITKRHKTAVHFTKLSVADKILSVAQKSDKDLGGKLRYYNAIYMNDPAEGDFIFNCFENGKAIRERYSQAKLNSKTSVYLGSFLTNKDEKYEDELVMWRTYGKDEKLTEAAGCSMVIDSKFFDQHETSSSSGILPLQGLYEVIYYKDKEYTHGSPHLIKRAMKSLESILMEMISIWNASTDDDDKATIDAVVFKSLSDICYLFKSADYSFEHEVRVIQNISSDSELIHTDESLPSKLYVLSNKTLLSHLHKIYIGPKAQNQDHWMTYLNFRIRERTRLDKMEYKAKVVKSTRNFR